jgi:glutamine synthetase
MPAITSYTNKLATTIATTKSVAPNLEMVAETSLLTKFSILNDRIYNEVLKLEETLINEPSFVLENARFYHDDILESMSVLRTYIDDAEANMDSSFWTLPTYTDLVFSV